MAQITQHEGEIGGRLIAWREAPWERTPVVYVHGVPNSAVQWDSLLARTGGLALDLPGFGRSAKPPGGPYSIAGLADAVEAFLADRGVGEYRLAVHDWGAVGLVAAQRAPERVRRLLIANAVPFLPGYRWHRVARLWRTRVVGELAMGFTTARMIRRTTGLPKEQVALLMDHFDHGTQRAILKLYRGADPDVLAQAGAGLGAITAPALILWGERDPFIPQSFARALGDALGTPDPEIEILPGAGHWFWLDDQAAEDRMVRFLNEPDG